MTKTAVAAAVLPVAGFVVVLSVATLCYWNALHGELVHDDRFAIKENMDIRPTIPLTQLFANDFWGKPMADPTSHKSYRPLTVLTFRLNYALHELSPWGYHAVNVALHAMASCLVMLVSWAVVFGDLQPAVTTGLLFATHPVHTEAVSGLKPCQVWLTTMQEQRSCITLTTPPPHTPTPSHAPTLLPSPTI